MDFLVNLFIGGTAFFVGVAIVVIAAQIAALAPHTSIRRAAAMAMLVGACIVAFSAAPLPEWAYALWAAALIAHFAHVRGVAPTRSTFRFWILLLTSAGLVALEVPYYLGRPLTYPARGVLYVLGDSLSMGADTLEENWPQRLGALAGLPVQNYAFGGATLGAARSNAGRIGDDATLVILEIGGNDLLGGTPVAGFEKDLRAILELVCREERAVHLLELPLPPGFNRYGKVQRRLAEAYGVQLVPRRILARVLSTDGATTDGLHLTGEGHAQLANALWSLRAQ